MKIVSTTGKATPGFKHLDGQTNLSNFGFISICSLERQTTLDMYFPADNQKKEGGEE
jgi:hypothetical protein